MPQAISLMQAVLAEKAQEAERIFNDALQAEVDPLHWCAVELGIGEAEVSRRSAVWAGLAFFDRVPISATPSLTPERLERLAEVRMLRLRLLDRDVAFAAPDFFGMLRLARMREADPVLARTICLVPYSALRDHLVRTAGDALLDGARQTLSRYWPLAVAQLELTRGVRWGCIVLLTLLVMVLSFAPLSGQAWALPIWFALVVLPALLRLATLVTPPAAEPQKLETAEIAELPIYSVLVPLRDEANMVDQVAAALKSLDYPAARLDIIFVVESRSPGTIRAVRRHLDDPRFALVVVPDAAPRTKPKALDFVLPFCRGEFLVVFDAEDRPQPDQLRHVAARFALSPETECIQARLVIDNGRRGWLPGLFAGEYAGQFAVILPALAQWGVVTPLGGTSNHFRVSTLRALGGWDAFNVTEDADLGVRLARRRMKIATTISTTFEEAPVSLRPWMGQRTRWMKGWLQTFAVHSRRPGMLLNDLGLWGTLLFQVLILGMILSPVLHLGLIVGMAGALLASMVMNVAVPYWASVYIAILLVGYGAAMLTNIFGLLRTGQSDLLPIQMALPFYWLLVGIATMRAFVEFARKPFYWFKTPHLAVRPGRDSRG